VFALATFAVLVPTVSVASDALYCGSGRGSTVQKAINKAIDDAENSASGEGLFTCTLVGDPIIENLQGNGYSIPFFRASVNMTCV
jgi:hypothetical protein